jgi:hypothetical protein
MIVNEKQFGKIECGNNRNRPAMIDAGVKRAKEVLKSVIQSSSNTEF